MIVMKEPRQTQSVSALVVLAALNALVLPFQPAMAQVDTPVTAEQTDDDAGEAEHAGPPSTVNSPNPKNQRQELDSLSRTLQGLLADYRTAERQYVRLAREFAAKASKEEELRAQLALNDLHLLKRDRDQIHLELRQTEGKLQFANKALELGVSPPADSATDEQLLKEQSLIKVMEQQYEKARATRPATSPSLLRMKNQIAIAKKEIAKKAPERTVPDLQKERNMLLDEYNKADAAYAEQRQKIVEMGDDAVIVLVLREELETLNKTIDTLRRIHAPRPSTPR